MESSDSTPVFAPRHLHLYLVTTLIIVLLSHVLRNRFRPGLRQLPGPFLASVSALDRVWSCASGLQMEYHIKLHKKYGRFVRIGPKHVSFADATLVPLVYGISSKFWKSDFYKMFDIKSTQELIPTIFSIRDEPAHRDMKWPVASAYSMSALKELEPMNDACSEIFSKKLRGMVGTNVDLGVWLHYYAFDVISSITFSNRLGFMEHERDVEGLIASIEGRLKYNSIIGQIPSAHKFLFGNNIVSHFTNLVPYFRRMNSLKTIVTFAARQLERYNNQEFNTVPLRDMLDRFKRFKDEEQLIDDATMLSHASGNILAFEINDTSLAGADTTAISLRAIFYYLLRNPTSYHKLLNEIDAADRAGRLSDPVSFAEAQALPYFQAVIKEALRMHPAVGLLLERKVPAGGADLGGVWLPEGTIVGMNPWVAARDAEVYGVDAEQFRPERWLEADEEQLKSMERSFLAFGAGTRTCLGKNISLLEMSKLVPQLLREFDFELSDPTKKWELHDYWFVKQTGLICRVAPRNR